MILMQDYYWILIRNFSVFSFAGVAIHSSGAFGGYADKLVDSMHVLKDIV